MMGVCRRNTIIFLCLYGKITVLSLDVVSYSVWTQLCSMAQSRHKNIVEWYQIDFMI